MIFDGVCKLVVVDSLWPVLAEELQPDAFVSSIGTRSAMKTAL